MFHIPEINIHNLKVACKAFFRFIKNKKDFSDVVTISNLELHLISKTSHRTLKVNDVLNKDISNIDTNNLEEIYWQMNMYDVYGILKGHIRDNGNYFVKDMERS